MKRILFQGDSVTDSGRFKIDGLGHGYPNLVASELSFDYPGEYEFINMGISGNRIVDLYARMKGDIINVKPDIMSILIGVNDMRNSILERADGVETPKFEKIYNMLIEEVRAEFPDIKLMLFGPFLLKGSASIDVWDVFRPGVEEKEAAVRRVAEKNGIPFIPLMEKFDAAAKIMPDTYWIADGLHPTQAGHELIKREWLKAFKNL
ncbi:MAG: SGNH/GDSL hydrolase family protein [Clostridia bacterium]|nr:SGNH/GDSL hydrolase family protein [Clostridia bacterium]